MWGQLHKDGTCHQGALPIIWSPPPTASSSCAPPPGLQMPHSPLSGLALACWMARCLVHVQTKGSDWGTVSYQCRQSKACCWGEMAGPGGGSNLGHGGTL